VSRWALDLGTSNTGLARWDEEAHRPRLLGLTEVCRRPSSEDHLEAPRLIPSATEVLPEAELSFFGRLGRGNFWLKRAFWGQHAVIGRPALERNESESRQGYAATFKSALQRAPLRTLTHRDGRQFSGRDVAQLFLRELLRIAREQTGERIRSLTITAPVDSYEIYRAELAGVARRLGIDDLSFVDEPVAAAIGYGVSLAEPRRVLVVDFGAGTLDLALVDLDVRDVVQGSCKVIAKAGRAIGGNTVDRWLLEDFSETLGYKLSPDGPGDEAYWYRLMLAEGRRVKEAIFFAPSDSFNVTPPEDIARFEARIRGNPGALRFDRDRLVSILRKRGLYEAVDGCLDQILEQMRGQGMGAEGVDEVLMVGGSTLLPEVFTHFEERFGRDRVRAWQPFEAVAYGACAYAAEAFSQSDFIVHDYAFVTYDPDTHDRRYTTIVPRGTRIPTARDFWTRKLVPTCSLGEPERMFKLVICELGRAADEGERAFVWDEGGRLHKLGGKGGEDLLVVELNQSNPTLGRLDPPHAPRDRKPRLQISFGVNSDRWLCAHVVDLKTDKVLLSDEPVVRLL
jgi:molecular chaperone DnaK (HSP70)